MKTRVLVGGIVCRDGKILMLKRTAQKRFLPGYFDLPGGKVEFGEDPNKTIIREVKEETNLDVEVVRAYNVWHSTNEFNDNTEHNIEIDFILKIVGDNEIKLSEKEHSEYRWISREGLPEPISDKLKATVEKFFS
ncbi:MAG: ADP-ribose pyrophosphatase [Candidatus Woesearchaeota archaeon]|nr:ADP-ribose pyrophosphatase [Candidatus Woesearchaeota archaeon]